MEYRTSTSSKIFYFIFFIGMSVLMLALIFRFWNEWGNVLISIIISPLFILGALLFLRWYLSLSTSVWKVEKDGLTYTEFGEHDFIKFTDILGTRDVKGSLALITKNGQIVVKSHLEGFKDFKTFLQNKILEPTVDQSCNVDEEKTDETKASKLIYWLYPVSMICGVCLFFIPFSYRINVGLNALIIVCSIVLTLIASRFKSLNNIKLIEYLLLSFFPTLGLCVRLLIDFDLFDFTQLILTSFTCSLILFIFCFIQYKKWFVNGTILDRSLKLGFTLYYFLLVLYSTIGMINCSFDFSEPVVNSVIVASKWEGNGDVTLFNIEIEPFSYFETKTHFKVSKKVYESIEVGEQTYISRKAGLLGFSWGYIK